MWPLLPCHLDLPARHPKHERVKVHIIGRIFLDGKAMVDAYREKLDAGEVTTELAKAGEWLRSNPTKSKRSNWRKFVTGWLSRCQDGGGTRTGGTQQQAQPPPQAKRRYWRDQFARNMTDEEFRLAKQALPEVKSLAAALVVPT